MPTTKRVAKPIKRVAKKVSKKTVKKVPTKKVSSKKVTSRKVPSKKVSTKRAVKKTTSKRKPNGQSLPRNLNDDGFVVGSQTEAIAEAIKEGGASRAEINAKVSKIMGKKTSAGNPPNVSSMVANILRKLVAKGYTVESSWTVVPPAANAPKRRRPVKKTAGRKRG